MYIEELWIENFRSIKRAHLKNLASYNVFYGPNGAGKSNVLAALEKLTTVIGRLGWAAWGDESGPGLTNLGTLVETPDFWAHTPGGHIVLGLCIDGGKVPMLEFSMTGASLRIQRLRLTVDIGRYDGNVAARGTRLEAALPDGRWHSLELLTRGRSNWRADDFPAGFLDLPDQARVEGLQFLADRLPDYLSVQLPARLYRLIPAVRGLAQESVRPRLSQARPNPAQDRDEIPLLLGEGRLKEALFRAKNSPNRQLRYGFAALSEVLQGEPLRRPPFDPVQDFQSGTYDLQEDLPNGDTALSLDRAGLGVQQLYAVLATILLSGSAAVGVEEPEAHLHGPTTGVQLRQLLRRVVDEGQIQQLFIATHSNLFDLNLQGYWDVRMDPTEGTQITWVSELATLHQRHLYEPGPALEALEDMLKLLGPDLAVFYTSGGKTITAGEMIHMLHDDDPIAFEFLRDVTSAAVRAVQIRAKKATTA